MAQLASEVSEADAQGKIRDIYADVKSTLRVPAASAIFRILATCPDYLQMAWRALKPNAQTVFFETCADDLRRQAVEFASGISQASAPSDRAGVQPIVNIAHYTEPKVFLAVALLRSATSGQQPGLALLHEEDKRQITPGIPPEMSNVLSPNPPAPDERVQRILDDVKNTLGLTELDAEYAALARWPDYLESSWHTLKPALERPEYTHFQSELGRTAEQVVIALPFRMEIYPHALRHAGLSELQIDSVRATLDGFYRAFPGLMAYAAFLALTLFGRQRALESPFPPSGP